MADVDGSNLWKGLWLLLESVSFASFGSCVEKAAISAQVLKRLSCVIVWG